MTTAVSGSTWRLNCCVIGKNPSTDVVGVYIQSTADVVDLKRLIKEHMKPRYDKTLDDDLHVWKVSINPIGLST
jgi:hypothetical protein